MGSHPTQALDAPTSEGARAVIPNGITEGTTIGGRYHVARWLGRGGMGSVYEVDDRALGATVALKIAEADVWSASTVAQLKREIMLARRVTHPNVCRVHDFGIHALPTGAGLPFLTMELVRGETLLSVLERDGPMPLARVIAIVDQIAAALDAAHEAGVVHRDFKTGNVMLEGERVIVTDFGLAVDVGHQTGEGAGSIVGSPAYMSPEQVRAAPITRGTDVYALGVVIYELLSGRLPFEGKSSLEVATRRLHQPPTPISTYLTSIESQHERVIERCLRLEPSERWASCGDVARALRGDHDAQQPEARVAWELVDAAGPRAMVVVIAEGVRDLRLIERRVVREAGLLAAPSAGRIEAVFGTPRSLGNEIDRALVVARAAMKVSSHVSIAIGRGTMQAGRLEGDVRDEADAALTRAKQSPDVRAIVTGDRTALALSARTELTPLGPGVHRVGSARHGSAPLVGRDVELATLRRSLDAVLDEQRVLATWVLGPPGIGKSRLLEAAAAMATERGVTVHFATASAEGGRAMGLLPGASHGPMSDEEYESTQSVDRMSDAEAQADRARAAAIAELERLTDAGPLAIVIDHAQWADAASLALLAELPLALPDRAVWVLLGARDEIVEQRPQLFAALEITARVEPSPLRASDAALLARTMLGRTPSAAFVQALVERTGGNPLFVEQLLASSPAVATEESEHAAWPLPATVELAVQAHLDRLPLAERECVGLLAVYGRPATARELEAMGHPSAQASLVALTRRSLVAHAAAEPGAHRLRNQVVADVAYRLLAPARRLALHARAAEVARAHGRDAEDVARHLAEAGDLVRAAELYVRATLEAAARGDARVVLRCGERAAALGLSPDVAFAVHFARAEAARFAADHADREALLDAASSAAKDDRERALVLVERGEWLRRGRHSEEALACFVKAIELAGRMKDTETQALATARRGSALIALGRVREAGDVLDALVPRLDAVSARTRAVALDVRGYLAGNVGDLGAQQRDYEQAAALYAEAGDARRAAGAESNLADAQNRLGRYAQAEAALRRALSLARKVGNRLTEGYALLNLGYASSFSGRQQEAIETLGRAIAIAKAIGDTHLELGARLYAARARLGSADAALVEELRAISREAGSDVTLKANALGLASSASLALGDSAAAADSADRALTVRASRGSVEEGEGEIFLAAACAYEAAGRFDDAKRIRAEAKARIEELAARIADPAARASFLHDVPAHRALT